MMTHGEGGGEAARARGRHVCKPKKSHVRAGSMLRPAAPAASGCRRGARGQARHKQRLPSWHHPHRGRLGEASGTGGRSRPRCKGLCCDGFNWRGFTCKGFNCNGFNCRGFKCNGVKCNGVLSATALNAMALDAMALRATALIATPTGVSKRLRVFKAPRLVAAHPPSAPHRLPAQCLQRAAAPGMLLHPFPPGWEVGGCGDRGRATGSHQLCGDEPSSYYAASPGLRADDCSNYNLLQSISHTAFSGLEVVQGFFFPLIWLRWKLQARELVVPSSPV